ncbi:hypothetical protein L2E82_50044 [Cichorium intybus]|nr:hypothetical protein L2E82_50044 [Cichorium intybus]
MPLFRRPSDRFNVFRFNATFLCDDCIKKMTEVPKDLTVGTIGRAAQLIVGHPFDTINVKLQSQSADSREPGSHGVQECYRKKGEEQEAVPKRNLELMNVDGIIRENVASQL